MPKQKEIKFRECCGDLVGSRNGMRFTISKEPGLEGPGRQAYWVMVGSMAGRLLLSTVAHQYFTLDGAKEFCRRAAAGEIDLEELRAVYEAEEETVRRAAIEARARLLRARLTAMGLTYRSFLELEALAHGLGEMGHDILLKWEEEGTTPC